MAQVRFVAVGDVMVDVLSEQAPSPGERLHAPIVMRAGGSAVNAAVWATALGASALVIGRVGADAAGDLVASGLAEWGVESALARDTELPTGIALALGEADASVIAASPGASARLAPADIPDPLEGDALLVSGFSLFQEGSAAGARKALDLFSGGWVAVDLASPRLARAAGERLGELAAGADVVLATAEEAEAVTGVGPEEAARILATRFAVVAVKLGSEGAVAARGDQLEWRAVDRVGRRSTFGAGDAFAAGLLVSLAEGEPLGEALEAACAAGSRAAASDVVRPL